MKSEWAVVFRTDNPIEASMVKSKLEDAGFPVFEKGETLGRVYGLTIGSLGIIEILVPSHLLEDAWELISKEEEP
ncbi:MAG: DUF2007 domain-containing protein [Coprothermobacterota bacterium]|nr:DUF2007 domain-containing protein [Coprothermobacterota bacterium]